MILIPFILLIVYLTGFAYLPYILDKKTRPKEYIFWSCETKSNVLFCFGSFFCFIFLNRIREWRKINYYKDRILNYDQNFVRMFGFESLPEKHKSEYVKMKRYIKLKKLNEKS